MQELVNAVSLGCIYLLFSLGMSLLWGTVGILNFAHGSIFMFAAFTNFLLLAHVSLPLLPLLAIGAIVGTLLAAAAYLFAFQPILRRAKDKDTAERQMLICGIGLASVPVAVAEIVTLGNPFSLSKSSFKVETYTIGDVRISNIQVLIILLSAAAAVSIAVWIRNSRNGLALRAIGVDAEVARLMGVNEGRLGLITMGVGGALAGLGGTLLIFTFGALDAQSGGTLLLKAFAIIILGGVGSVGGTAVAALLLALAETIVVMQTSGAWVDAISFALLFIFLIVRPHGIFGRKEVRRT